MKTGLAQAIWALRLAREHGTPTPTVTFLFNGDLPVLCGVGAVGDGAHGRGEFIYPDTVPAQTALVAGLLGRLTEPLRT